MAASLVPSVLLNIATQLLAPTLTHGVQTQPEVLEVELVELVISCVLLLDLLDDSLLVEDELVLELLDDDVLLVLDELLD